MRSEAEIRKHLADLKYAAAKLDAVCPAQARPWMLRNILVRLNLCTWTLAWALEELVPEYDNLVEEVAAMVREL